MLLPVRSSKQVPAVEHRRLWHHPEEGISSGCPYLSLSLSPYMCTYYTTCMLVMLLFTRKMAVRVSQQAPQLTGV